MSVRSVSVLLEPLRVLQAGNKSALSYRCDIGVPGYTGYIPQTAAIPLQVKGSTKYIGEALAPTLCMQFALHNVGPCLTITLNAGRTIEGLHKDAPAVDPADYHAKSW